jgi:hypothetical protein
MRTITRIFSIISLISLQLPAQNILNNGGFESGLMCYSEWIWSATGIDFRGDYRFHTSTDAHSGTYSLEIACEGGDCMRAGIWTDHIPASPGTGFKLSLYSKCPAGRTAYITGDTYKPLACTGQWERNETTFTAGGSDLTLYIVNADTSWLRVDDVELTYTDGKVPQAAPLHPGTRSVSVSGQQVSVDNKPFLSLGYFDVPYDQLAAVASTGANTVNSMGYQNAAACFNIPQTSYLDRAYELGLNFLPDSSTTSRLRDPGVFPQAVQTFGPHLANIGWFLVDEPDLIEIPWIYVPPATLVSQYNAIKTRTNLPVIADFQRGGWGTSGEVQPYAGSVDVWMAEPYGPDFAGVTHAVNLFNSIQSKPIWLAQDDIDPQLIVPKAYWAIIQGVTGIHYFPWYAFQQDGTKLAATKQVFSELTALQGAIFGANKNSLVTPPNGIGTAARTDSAGSMYIFAVNPAAQPVSGTFQVQGLAAGQAVTVLFENRTLTSFAGGFQDGFSGIGRHVYTIAPPVTPSSSGGFTPIRVNAGGPAATDSQGRLWSGDTGYLNGNVFSTAAAIGNTSSPALYQTERWFGSMLAYRFNVPNGTYTVNLKFAEIYLSSPAQRLFNILLNGQQVQTAFDIVAAAGGPNIAVDRSFTVAVTNGAIDIQLVGVAQNPKISAIEILQGNSPGPSQISVAVFPPAASLGQGQSQQFTASVSGSSNTGVTWSLNPPIGTVGPGGNYTAPSTITSAQTVTLTATSAADGTASSTASITLTPPAASSFSPIRINAGGPAYTDLQARVWNADTGYMGGYSFATSTGIGNTPNPALYQTERWNPSVLEYQLAVPNGTYTVNLKFAEIYHSRAGERVFNIVLNGQLAQSSFDIVAAAGGPNLAVDRPFLVTVTNGIVDIQLVPIVGNPKISAIEIF